MVVFRDEPEKYSGPEVFKQLEEQLNACIKLDKRVLAMDEDIQVNSEIRVAILIWIIIVL